MLSVENCVTMLNYTMKAKSKVDEAEFVAKDVPKPKTLDLRVALSASDWGREIMRAFNLAKSAGRELNATFTAGPS